MLSIQTGINEPRYVGMRGIRQVASIPIPKLGAPDLALALPMAGKVNAKVRRAEYFVPPAGKEADMLQGGRDEVIDNLWTC